MQRNACRIRDRFGFSIVELLCAVGIVGMLAGLVLPAVQRARESARCAQCRSHLREIGVALHAFEGDRQNLPPGWLLEPTHASAYGWPTDILSRIEQSGLAEKLDRNRVIDDARNEAVLRVVPLLTCPSDSEPDRFALYRDEGEHEGYGQTSDSVLMMLPSANYVGCFGTHDPDEQDAAAGEGAFIAGRGVRLSEFERGLSQTILVGERTARKLPSTWVGFLVKGEDGAARVTGFAGLGPNRDDADEAEFDSRHDASINILWGDGRVDSVSNGIDQTIYRLMAQRRSPRQ